jgi:hypothetical protein
MATLDGHRTAELRSLAYHRRVAEKLRTDPSLIRRAREGLEGRLKQLGADSVRAHYARGWHRLLSGPLDELIAFMISDDSVSRDFRQSSPFAGALGARERWRLWRDGLTASAGDEHRAARAHHPRGRGDHR